MAIGTAGTTRAAALRVEPFTGGGEAWDEFVRGQRGWTHFHLFGWKSVMERALGHECLYLVATDGGVIAGVLPLVRVKSLVFGHYLVSMPFLNYGGPLGTDAAVRALGERAELLVRRGAVKLLEFRSRVPLPLDMTVSHRKITVVLDLPEAGPELLFKKLDAKVRSQVRRPQKEGVTVRFGADQVEPFFEVFARHMRDLGTPTQGRRLFETIADVFPETAVFGCAYLGDAPIACGAGFEWDGEFEMTWASSLREHARIAPNMLLYWSFMERAMRAGLRVFNFGRCSPGGGTHKFKLQWGGRDEQLWWYARAEREGTTTPNPHEGAFSWGPRIWQKLPHAVATAVGPQIVRFIP